MLEYSLLFYNNYTFLFYIWIILAVIIEWPITILILSILATKINLSFFYVYAFAFFWEFLWDILHYFVWRFFKKNIVKDKEFKIFEKIEKKLVNHSLFDKLIVIKYTPPITSIWLLYLGFQKTNFKEFLINITIFSTFNSLIVTLIWYYFWAYFANKNELKYIIIWIMFGFLLLYLLIRVISYYFVKNILNGK